MRRSRRNPSLRRVVASLSLLLFSVASAASFVPTTATTRKRRRTAAAVTTTALPRTAALVSSTVLSSSTSTTTTSAAERLQDVADNNPRRRRRNGGNKRTLRDRTPEEVGAFLRDVVRAAADAGGGAGPRRTLDAYRAAAETAREVVLPRLGGGLGGFGGGSTDLPNLPSDPQRLVKEEDLPVVLRTFFEKMGSTYIKLGQFVASSPTLFPAPYVKEFQSCLDRTRPLPWTTVRRVLQQEFGGNAALKKTFRYIDPKPLASASIAQVHRAKLRETGDEVVLKIQKPGIGVQLRADLNFVYVAARVLEFLNPDLERTSLADVASDLRASMLEELDFCKEAQNTIEFGRFLQEARVTHQATCPRVYLQYTTERVLCLEYLNGRSLLDENTVHEMTSTENPRSGVDTIITALNIWSLSVAQMPWFHADVHAGNLLLLKDGRVGFIDFGIVGRISEKVFNSVTELSTALAINDAYGMARALTNMGAADERVDIDQFAKDIERLMYKINSSSPISGVRVASVQDPTGGASRASAVIDVNEQEVTDLVLELVEVTENNGLKLPREFGLLVKQSLYFDRYLKILAPNVDVMNDDRVMIGGKPRQEYVNGDAEPVEVEVLV